MRGYVQGALVGARGYRSKLYDALGPPQGRGVSRGVGEGLLERVKVNKVNQFTPSGPQGRGVTFQVLLLG